ncbi:MAG: hypothetical protein WBA39_20245 [Rivularia sp. (in: cyanobacteria)]
MSQALAVCPKRSLYVPSARCMSQALAVCPKRSLYVPSEQDARTT